MSEPNNIPTCRLCDIKLIEEVSKCIFDEVDLAQKISDTLSLKVC